MRNGGKEGSKGWRVIKREEGRKRGGKGRREKMRKGEYTGKKFEHGQKTQTTNS